jgi:hypothetical protein
MPGRAVAAYTAVHGTDRPAPPLCGALVFILVVTLILAYPVPRTGAPQAARPQE